MGGDKWIWVLTPPEKFCRMVFMDKTLRHDEGRARWLAFKQGPTKWHMRPHSDPVAVAKRAAIGYKGAVAQYAARVVEQDLEKCRAALRRAMADRAKPVPILGRGRRMTLDQALAPAKVAEIPALAAKKALSTSRAAKIARIHRELPSERENSADTAGDVLDGWASGAQFVDAADLTPFEDRSESDFGGAGEVLVGKIAGGASTGADSEEDDLDS